MGETISFNGMVSIALGAAGAVYDMVVAALDGPTIAGGAAGAV